MSHPRLTASPVVSPYAHDAPALLEWIRTQQYEAFEVEAHRIKKHGRARNQLFNVHLEGEPATVMKVTTPDPRYRARRRAELYVQQLFKDHNLNAFRACCALYDAGLPVATPLAWWRVRTGVLARKSYFLYRYVDAEQSAADVFAQCNDKDNDEGNDESDDESDDEVRLILCERIVSLVRSLHHAGWRHHDLHIDNILVSTATDDIKTCALTLIDYDKCAPIRAYLRCLPQCVSELFYLRCLRFVNADTDRVLAFYFGETPPLSSSPSPMRQLLRQCALQFWKSGGFSLSRRLRRWRRRPKGAHLKKHP